MKFVQDILRLAAVMVLVVLSVERPGDGAAKKIEAVQKMKEILAEPGGIDMPPLLAPYEDWFLSLLVDLVVMALNKGVWSTQP